MLVGVRVRGNASLTWDDACVVARFDPRKRGIAEVSLGGRDREVPVGVSSPGDAVGARTAHGSQRRPAPTGPRPTAKSNASTAPSSRIIVSEGCVAGPRYVRGVASEAVREAMRCERAMRAPDPSDAVSVVDPAGRPDAAASSVAIPTPALALAGTRPVASRGVR